MSIFKLIPDFIEVKKIIDEQSDVKVTDFNLNNSLLNNAKYNYKSFNSINDFFKKENCLGYDLFDKKIKSKGPLSVGADDSLKGLSSAKLDGVIAGLYLSPVGNETTKQDVVKNANEVFKKYVVDVLEPVEKSHYDYEKLMPVLDSTVVKPLIDKMIVQINRYVASLKADPLKLRRHYTYSKKPIIYTLISMFNTIMTTSRVKEDNSPNMSAAIGKDEFNNLTLYYNPKFFARLIFSTFINKFDSFEELEDQMEIVEKSWRDIIDYVMLHEMAHIQFAHMLDNARDADIFGLDGYELNVLYDSHINDTLDRHLDISPNPGIHGGLYIEFFLIVPDVYKCLGSDKDKLRKYLQRNWKNKIDDEKVTNNIDMIASNNYSNRISSDRLDFYKNPHSLSYKYDFFYEFGKDKGKYNNQSAHLCALICNKNPHFGYTGFYNMLRVCYMSDFDKKEGYLARFASLVGALPFMDVLNLESPKITSFPKPESEKKEDVDSSNKQALAAIMAEAIINSNSLIYSGNDKNAAELLGLIMKELDPIPIEQLSDMVSLNNIIVDFLKKNTKLRK